MYNIVEIFIDFYFTKYLFVACGVLGAMCLIKKIVLGR